jgi:hypothetical protein
MTDPVFLDVELADYAGDLPKREVGMTDPVAGDHPGDWWIDNRGNSWFDPHQWDPIDLTFGDPQRPVGSLFNKPISWMGYPPKEVRCSQCQRHMPGVTLPADVDVTSMVIFCDECRAMRDRSGS